MKPSRETLYKQYVTLGMTLSMLQYLYGKTFKIIKGWLNEYKIPTRRVWV